MDLARSRSCVHLAADGNSEHALPHGRLRVDMETAMCRAVLSLLSIIPANRALERLDFAPGFHGFFPIRSSRLYSCGIAHLNIISVLSDMWELDLSGRGPLCVG